MTTSSPGDPEGHALARLASLQLPASAKALCQQLRARLLAGSSAREIVNPPQEVMQSVTLLSPPAPVVAAAKAAGVRGGVMCILGGDKNQARSRSLRHFERPDGAWFDFAITVGESRTGLALLAYDFEIRFPVEGGVPFVRFDLNLPGHANEARAMRCHVHPGSDELQVPSPLLSPVELLELFIAQIQPTRSDRAPTAFDLAWHRAFVDRHATGPVTSAAGPAASAGADAPEGASDG